MLFIDDRYVMRREARRRDLQDFYGVKRRDAEASPEGVFLSAPSSSHQQ